MSKIIIVEGNSNDKDQVRNYMVKGERGYSAYDLYVQNGGTLTEEQWLDEFLNADNFYNKSEANTLLDGKVDISDIVNNLTSTATNKPLSAKQGKVLKDLIDHNETTILGMIYPVGSIYLSVSDANPTTIFGGTWVQIKDTFLLACGDTYTAGDTGGEATHTLTVNEMPSHNHAPLTSDYRFTEQKASSGSTDPSSSGSGTWLGGTESTTGNTGGGQAHNNMPPYLAVYMWKRTA